MTKPQAIQDAKKRTEKTGLTWLVIKIRIKRFLWFFGKYRYDTVTEHHETTHATLYASGKFKKVYICEPEYETEWSYSNILRQPGENFNQNKTVIN